MDCDMLYHQHSECSMVEHSTHAGDTMYAALAAHMLTSLYALVHCSCPYGCCPCWGVWGMKKPRMFYHAGRVGYRGMTGGVMTRAVSSAYTTFMPPANAAMDCRQLERGSGYCHPRAGMPGHRIVYCGIGVDPG